MVQGFCGCRGPCVHLASLRSGNQSLPVSTVRIPGDESNLTIVRIRRTLMLAELSRTQGQRSFTPLSGLMVMPRKVFNNSGSPNSKFKDQRA